MDDGGLRGITVPVTMLVRDTVTTTRDWVVLDGIASHGIAVVISDGRGATEGKDDHGVIDRGTPERSRGKAHEITVIADGAPA